MKQRRIIVCSTEYRHCHTDERTFLHEFILLVPKGQQFDGVVNVPTKVVELPENKKSECKKFPYKRPPINISLNGTVLNPHSVTKYSEMMLNVFGDLITVELNTIRYRNKYFAYAFSDPLYIKLNTMEDCKEWLNDYDYYTIFELESKNSCNSPLCELEIKRLLQAD